MLSGVAVVVVVVSGELCGVRLWCSLRMCSIAMKEEGSGLVGWQEDEKWLTGFARDGCDLHELIISGSLCQDEEENLQKDRHHAPRVDHE